MAMSYSHATVGCLDGYIAYTSKRDLEQSRNTRKLASFKENMPGGVKQSNLRKIDKFTTYSNSGNTVTAKIYRQYTDTYQN